jgi:hypothetical protein
MADTVKVLAQVAPVLATLTTLYTVPAATSTVLSSIVICNTGAMADTARLSIAVAGAADGLKQYVYRDLTIKSGATWIATVGLTLAATDVVRCYSTLGTLSFQVFGVEIT